MFLNRIELNLRVIAKCIFSLKHQWIIFSKFAKGKSIAMLFIYLIINLVIAISYSLNDLFITQIDV